MGFIGRDIVSATCGAELIVCAGVAPLGWLTHALRDIEPMTSRDRSLVKPPALLTNSSIALIELGGVSTFRLNDSGHFLDRMKGATLELSYWRLEETRFYASGAAPVEHEVYRLSTSLTPTQVKESFATPATVPFWQLSSYMNNAEKAGLAAAGYRLQYYQLRAQPLYLIAMVLVSLRFFRFGGVQIIVLGGVGAGFLLYVMAKITGDLRKAGLMAPLGAAGLPPAVGAVTGLIALLYQEDG